MKTEIIQNQYDGPKPPAKSLGRGTFSLDYANPEDAQEIDTGIRKAITGIRLSILAMGIGLARIKTRGCLEGVIVEAGEVILPVRLYDMDELRRFGKAAERLKRELREKR